MHNNKNIQSFIKRRDLSTCFASHQDHLDLFSNPEKCPNISSYWSKGTSATNFYDFWIHYEPYLKTNPIAEVRVTILDKASFFLKEKGALDWEKSRGFTSSHVRLIYLGWYWVLCPCLFSLQELDPSEKALILWYPCGNLTRVLFQFVFYFKQEELQISWGLFPCDLFVCSSSEQS